MHTRDTTDTTDTRDIQENRGLAMRSTQTMHTTRLQARTQVDGPSADTHARMASTGTLLSAVIVPRTTSTREITVLETAMQGLALDSRHPVALELAATATSRRFLLRATEASARLHLEDQVQARYPQATMQAVQNEEDPLALREGEIVAARELRAGAAAYLPLRNWRERELLQEGADPLLGILAVFNHLPARMRVVVQLALIPASPTWSQAYRRKAVEHPLEPERLCTRRDMSDQSSGPGTLQLVGMGVLVAILLLWWRFQRQLAARIPPWLLQVALSLLHGKIPRFTPARQVELEVVGVGIQVAIFCLGFVLLQITSRIGTTPIYDMRLVGEKTARPAYRVRLRLFVFAPVPEQPLHYASRSPEPPSHQTAILLPGRSWHRWSRSALVETYRHWRGRVHERKRHRQAYTDVLDHLSAAYRQYHTAAGGYFVPHALSPARAHRLLVQSPKPRLFAHPCIHAQEGGTYCCTRSLRKNAASEEASAPGMTGILSCRTPADRVGDKLVRKRKKSCSSLMTNTGSQRELRASRNGVPTVPKPSQPTRSS